MMVGMTAQEPTTVALVSLGCPKNLVDSEKMLGLLAEAGCVVGAPMDEADVIVVNTCGFLAAARDEAMGVIAEALEHKRAGRAKRVVVAGCLATRDGELLYSAAAGIDAVVGVDERDDIAAAVLGRPVSARNAPPIIHSDRGRLRVTAPHTAYLRISEGCGRRCTFCTIPSIRGPYRSKPMDEVLADARELLADGAVELNVIGQDTTAYGQEMGGPSLAELLRALDALDGVEWVRLLYAYPHGFTRDVIDAMAGCRHVVPYVDLPLQHIADGVLRRMGRGFGRRRTEQLLQRIGEGVPGVAVRTTFIVGFPGETEADFEQLLAFVEGFRFDALGVFEFSPEPGTPAAKMDGQVPDEVKADRAERIMLAQQEIAFAANEAMLGRRLRVLVDGRDAGGRTIARHAGQAPDIDSVVFVETAFEPGTFADVVVTGVSGYDLLAES